METKEYNDKYPMILWPTEGVEVVPPQSGVSDIRGYSDDYFWKLLNDGDLGMQIRRNCHLEVPCRAIPYEPAMVLVDESSGIFIDVEIDAPYHGWYRVPLHCTDGKDSVRDGYFNRCGWTVVRFTERQVRKEPEACVELVRTVVRKWRGEVSEIATNVTPEKRWTFKEAVVMERDLVREKYLGVQTFGQPEYLQELRQKIMEKRGGLTDASRPENHLRRNDAHLC